MPVIRRRPQLSVVVVCYQMSRELPRTLRSLSAGYQKGLDGIDYEILVVDNGSPEPVDADAVARIDHRIRVHRIDDAPPSPAHAGNLGVSMTTAPAVALILDGARMVSPGVLGMGLRAMALSTTSTGFRGTGSMARGARRPIVTPMAWHLGPAHQSDSVRDGYGPQVEDQLLESIKWPANGYRLFDIAVLAGSNKQGFFGRINESCCLMVPRSLWRDVDGLDERFDRPGGGLVSIDLFTRLVHRDDTELIVLLGEGSFHQVHGGVSTSPEDRQQKLSQWYQQYRELTGAAYEPSPVAPTYFGTMPEPARRWILP